MKFKSFLYLISALFITSCTPTTDNNDEYFSDDALTDLDYTNEYSYIDSYKPHDEIDTLKYANKWKSQKVETKWFNYKGIEIRAQILNGNRDLREMKLRMFENSTGADIDGDNRYILSQASNYIMKQICGRNAKSIAVVYDKASFEINRPTPFFDYKVTDEGSTIREYGFRCVF